MIAIDLGSNTIRFIEYDGTRWGKSFEKIVRTAESLHETSRIGVKALHRILAAIEEAKKIIDFENQPISAYTTAAVRMADNGTEILKTIESETGVSFRIIDGEKEAALTLLAVKNRLANLNMPIESFILSDIGGGSTELVIVDSGKTHSISIPVGIVTMCEKAQDEKMLDQLLNDFKDKVSDYYASLNLIHPLQQLVLTAGTPTTIAAYLLGMDYSTYDPMRINGTILTRSDCGRSYSELMQMSETERARYVGVGRELLIATGIKIVESLFDALHFTEAVVIDDGLREGIALEYFN